MRQLKLKLYEGCSKSIKALLSLMRTRTTGARYCTTARLRLYCYCSTKALLMLLRTTGARYYRRSGAVRARAKVPGLRYS